MRHPIDIVSDIVDRMRDTSTIVSITDLTGNVYRVKVHDLKDIANNDYVTISGTTNFNDSYQISSVNQTNRTFNISKTSGFSTESGTYKAQKPYYIYGHLMDVVNELAIKDKSAVDRFKKYPCVILPLDVNEDMKFTSTQCDITIGLIIANATKPDYRASERKTINFDAILTPLYQKLLYALKGCPYVSGFGTPDFPHTKIDRYFWGRETVRGNLSNILNDYVDAIEIQNLNLSIKSEVLTCKN